MKEKRQVGIQTFLKRLGHQETAEDSAADITAMKRLAVSAIGISGTPQMIDKVLKALNVNTDPKQATFFKMPSPKK